jgi:hypothetical protein
MIRHTIVLQAATPIAHGDTVTGIDNSTNTRLFMRQGMIVNGIPARVPALSENALRSTVFRETLSDHLVQTLGIQKGEMPQAVMNLLFSGGNMAAGSKAPAQEIAYGHAVKKLYPHIDLLGGAVDAFILPRSRLRLACWLVAEEYAGILEHVAPDLAKEARQASAFDLIAEETRTRGTGEHSSGNQMLYTYETLCAGAKVVMEITIDPHAPSATVASAAHAFAVWDGYIGGQGRQGRGRMAVLQNTLTNASAYLEHIEANRDAMKAGLCDGTLGAGARLCAA